MDDLNTSDDRSISYRAGTHRAVSPIQTLARVQPLLGRFGITRIANLTGLDRTGIPVVMVCRPNSRSSAVFLGKGIDLAAAKASGVMEAIETWHAEQVTPLLRLGSAAELRQKVPLIDVDGLPRVPGSRFHPYLPMLWCEGRDLIGQENLWLPFDLVHVDATSGDLPGKGCFSASTNGLASGNQPGEAISHALCEVIERDATSLWNQDAPARQDAARLNLATVDDERCRAILRCLDDVEIDVAVWDVTTDVGVPAFLCLLADRQGEYGHTGRGAGCHPTREVALLRAFTEAAQVRTTYVVGAREDIEHADYAADTLQQRNRRVRALMRAAPDARDFQAIATQSFDAFDREIQWILERLQAVGLRQAVVADLTQAAYGIPVVRIVVPGLEGSDHHAGYSPGARAQARARRYP